MNHTSTRDRQDATALARDPNYTPPFGQALPLGIQHVLAMFAGNITVPLIVAGALGSDASERAFLIQAAMLVAGVATLIQTLGIGPVGARLPIMQGTSFGFIPVLIPIAQTFGLAAVFGGALVGAVAQVILGAVLPFIRQLFPPLVTGLAVTTIGLSLLPVGVRYAAGGVGSETFGSPQNLMLATFVLVSVLVMRVIGVKTGNGFLASAAILFGLIIGYLIAIPLGMVDFSGLASAAWLAFPVPLQFGLSFPAGAVIGMIIMAFVTTVETIGDISGITMGGGDREPTNRELSGGILADGVGSGIAAIFGAFPNTSYSQNVGLVAFTGLLSRHVVSIGAVFLILTGFIPKLGALVAAMPLAVLGGGTLVMFGLVAASGIRLLSYSKLSRNALLTIAVSLAVGLGFLFAPDAAAQLPDTLRILLVSGIIPVTVLAVLLNQLLPDKG